jgi:hypothetical protein
MQYQGVWGLVVLILDVWAIVNIFQSGADTGKKVLWIVLVVILPVLGFILWYFLGPKSGATLTSSACRLESQPLRAAL